MANAVGCLKYFQQFFVHFNFLKIHVKVTIVPQKGKFALLNHPPTNLNVFVKILVLPNHSNQFVAPMVKPIRILATWNWKLADSVYLLLFTSRMLCLVNKRG